MACDKFEDVRNPLPNLNDMLPFRFDAEELREVIVALHDYTEGDPDSAFDSARDFEKIAIADKNRLNGVSPLYHKEIIIPDVAQFPRIEDFLKNPRNKEFADLYHDSANDLKPKILLNRDRFPAFDNVFLHLSEEIQRERDALRGKRRMVRTLLHYMYWNCDIGLKITLSAGNAHT